MEKFLTAVGWVNIGAENWTSFGYYSLQYACSLDFFLTNEEYRLFNDFTLSFVLYNLIVGIVILISYVVMTNEDCENENTSCFVQCRCCNPRYSCKRFLNKLTFFNKNDVRSAENNAVFKRISIIIFTDLMCWISLCIASLVLWHFSSNHSQNRRDFLTNLLSFQTAMLVLVSINSILNPYIYSFHLWRYLFKKIKSNFSKK